MENQFSALNRSSILNNLQIEHFDILIIGGGITGAGIALDATSRGLKVALVEKNDFAYGTSSRSTKLIHGGLRYLKQLEFGLVKEVGSERAIVHRLAPHLVIPEKMLLPLYEKRGMGYWLTSIGLRIYDLLAGVKSEDQRKMLTRIQTLKHEPLLRKDDIKGGAIYAEYRTDDARLTIEIMKKAVELGTHVINYCKVLDFLYQNNFVSGVTVEDVITNDSFTIKATTIINATGPWVDELREINKSKQGKRLHLTKGVHIVVSRAKFPVRQAIYFDVEDGRMIFAIPRGRSTYIGTTDTNYYEKQDDVHITQEDSSYLIKAVNAMFPSLQLTNKDIESGWAGLRPLIHEEGKSASELSRKDEIFESASGLISIAGGKLTGYRKMAERVVDLVIEKRFKENESLEKCETDRISFSSFTNSKQVNHYIQRVAKRLDKEGIDSYYATYLVHTYGKQTEMILSGMKTIDSEDKELRMTRAELEFTIQNEMTLTPLDFFVRRTGMLYFDIHRLEKMKESILEVFKNAFTWTDSEMNKHREALDRAIDAATQYKN